MIKIYLILCVVLSAMTLGFGQTTLINWTFENATKRTAITDDASFQTIPYTADSGIVGNIDTKYIKTVGRPVFTAFVTGSGGTGTYAPNANTWADGNGTKYWEISLVTTGYASLLLSSKQYGSSTGPKDFKVQYSLDESSWTDVSGAVITVAGNWTSGVLNNISLPTACDNQAVVYLRWIMTSNTSIGDATVGDAGTNRIDDINVSGSIANVSNLVVSETALSDFTYIVNNGPSAEQSFTVSGSNLSTNIMISAPVDYEISTGTGVSFIPINPISLAQSGGIVETTTIYVRLKAALSVGNYNNEDISISSTGAITQYVTCSGTVTTPEITVSTSSLSGFTYMLSMGPSQEQSFTVYGTSLYSILVLTAPADYEISSTSGSNYSSSVLLSPTGNVVNTTTIYVRMIDGLATGNYNDENITASSSGAANKTVTCSGSVTSGAPPDTPLATDANYVAPTSFTSNWIASPNTTSYRLDVYTGSANVATELFISEYVEGTSNNKYIEIYNGTDLILDLSDYKLQLYSNGATTPNNDVTLSGTLANGDCIVFKNSAAVLPLPGGVSAIINAAVNFNGDDAVALYKISTASFVDIFGRIGEQPPSGYWGTDPLLTQNKTLVRKGTVIGGVITNPTSGFPTLATEWDSYPTDTAAYLGSHTFGSRSITYVPGYENLDVGNVTNYAVIGLSESTAYHYIVRAVNSFGTSGNSNEIDVTTPSSTAPLIMVNGTLTTFSTTQGNPSTAQSYTLSSSNLTENISMAIPAGFELSADGGSNYYSTSLSVSSSFNGTILVRLIGSVSGTYSGNIVHSSSGATSINLFVYGNVTGGAIIAPTVQSYNIVTYPSTTSISLEWTPGNGAYRVVKINTVNSFSVPADGTSPTVSTGYSGSGEQVIYNGTTEFIEGVPYNGCSVTNLIPNTVYWFRIYDYNGTGSETKYLSASATNNPKSATTTTSSGSGYYSSIYGYGTTIKGLLHTLIKTSHTTQFSYTSIINQLKYTDEDPSNSSNLIEIYTGWSVNKEDFGAGVTDWNREHTWSKSHGDFGDVAPAGTDLHHLRPCDSTVNSRKSNKDFDNGGNAYTDNSPPAGYTGVTGCYDTSNTWEPRTADKGDVARIIMYMAVRYEGDDSNFNVDLELVDYVYSDAGTYQPYYGKLATLLQWHVQDPPDSRELQRNNRIAERQGNRNPFIDLPGYAARIWTPCPLYNSNITTTSFTGNWSTPISATGYYLQVANDSLFTSIVSGYNNLEVNLVSDYVVSGLSPGRTYYYRLRSYFINDYSMYSPYLTVTTDMPTAVATSATSITTTGFTANWQPASGITNFQFDLSTSNTFNTFVTGYNSLAVTSASLNINALDYNTIYYYRIRAVYLTLTGPNSNVISATTLNIAPPAAPTNLTVMAIGDDIVLNWDLATVNYWTIYSSDTPYGVFEYEGMATYPTNTFTITGDAILYNKRFYYVKANN